MFTFARPHHDGSRHSFEVVSVDGALEYALSAADCHTAMVGSSPLKKQVFSGYAPPMSAHGGDFMLH